MTATMLIVEDDETLRITLERSFRRRGYEVSSTSRADETRRFLEERSVDLVLMDLRLPDTSGMELLDAIRDVDTEILVVVMTAFPDVRSAVHAMKVGASDFIIKPFELEELRLIIERALETRALRREVRRLSREQGIRDDVSEILGESPAIDHVRQHIRKVAGAGTPVLIVGETGTGKELVADSIHRSSEGAGGPLVKVNCSAFSEQLLESELFGHEKGAFTDAREARAGLFEMSDGGTLFLDEISEMKPGLQAKLLRMIEGHPFRRVGGQREICARVRVIAATNRDLPAGIRAGQFRADLYYRLNAFQILVPPLRDRGPDIVMLARFFLGRSARALRKPPLTLDPACESVLGSYGWPGNVRELRNLMERAAILSDSDTVGPEHLPTDLQVQGFVRRQAARRSDALPSLEEIKQAWVNQVVDATGGNLSEAARILGVARNTLKAWVRISDASSEGE